MTKDRNQAYTPEEVAQQLQIAKHTVYELIKRGELGAFRVGNKMRIEPPDLDRYKLEMKQQLRKKYQLPADHDEKNSMQSGLTLVGSHDFLVEELIRQMNKMTPSVFVHSSFLGSLEGLMMVYQGEADIAAVHMKDPHTGEYNLPFIRRLFIHEPISVIRLADRRQGLIVEKGNPKRIHNWEDLLRNEVRMINRQKGSGTRYLLDATLAKKGIFPAQINGYDQQVWTHMDAAAAIAAGQADVALGVQEAAHKLNLTFIPVATESFDLVCRRKRDHAQALEQFIHYLQSEKLKRSLQKMNGYDYGRMGEVIYEIKNY